MTIDLTDRFANIIGPAFVMFKGLPASGKTSAAKKVILANPPGRIARVNRDDLRRSLCVEPNYDTPQEEIITVAQYALIDALLRRGVIVICDNTNLNAAHVATLRAITSSQRVPVYVVDDFLMVSPEECVARDARRDPIDRVGETRIMSMWTRFLAEQEGRAL